MNRILYQIITGDQNNGGVVLVLILGRQICLIFFQKAILYLCVLIYFIYKRFLSVIFEDLICLIDGKDNEEALRPMVYAMLNSILYLILCFFSTFSSTSDFGLSILIGSDMFNLFIILGIIFYKYFDQNHGNLDTWITYLYFIEMNVLTFFFKNYKPQYKKQSVRDTIIYLIGIFILFILIQQNFINLWSALILFTYYLINYAVISNNEYIKDKILIFLNLKNEDDEFNSDEHFQTKKRRNSLTLLQELQCFDNKDVNLQRKLNRMEALLILKYQNPDHPEKIIRSRFQKIVYQIIFAQKNYVKIEKEERLEAYNKLYQVEKKITPNKTTQDQVEQNNEEQDKIEQQEKQQEENINEDVDPLIFKNKAHDVNTRQEKNQEERIDENNPNQDKIDNEEDPEEGKKISLKMPKSITHKILFILFYPIFIILYLVPNYIENPIPKKLALCVLINILILSGCAFLIDWWSLEISTATGIPISILGLIIGGLFLNVHFLEYNYRVASEEKQLEFVQSFFQIGICKISLCPAIPWAINLLINLKVDVMINIENPFSIELGLFGLFIFIFFLCCAICDFKIRKTQGKLFIILYFTYFITAIVILAILQ